MQAPTLAIDSRFKSPQPLGIVLRRLEQDLEAFGFYHDARNADPSTSEAYLHCDPISESGYIDWPDYDREFKLGEAIEFTFVSRDLFRSSRGDEGAFSIALAIMTGNSIKGGALGIHAKSNMLRGYSNESWWPKVERIIFDLGARIHESCDSGRTVVYWDEPEGDSIQKTNVIQELSQEKSRGTKARQ
jgi:hypothetical protein